MTSQKKKMTPQQWTNWLLFIIMAILITILVVTVSTDIIISNDLTGICWQIAKKGCQ